MKILVINPVTKYKRYAIKIKRVIKKLVVKTLFLKLCT